MTATIDRVETATYTTAYARPDVLAARDLLDTLQGTVAAVAHVDPDDLDSGLPAGRELLRLAGLGREATAGLGESSDPGATVTNAPGVVVVRELVAATRRLASAVALTARP
jgi:hypothetical protein